MALMFNVPSFITAVIGSYDVFECSEKGLSGRMTPKLSHSYERNADTFRVSVLMGLAMYPTSSYGACSWLEDIG
jgi:hypothetical protein